MSQVSAIEERLERVEKEVAELKSQVTKLRSKGNWIQQISGSFQDDPEFDEILRLGRQFRQNQRSDGESEL